MKIQQIRSATLKVNFAGTTFLIDPWLASRWAMGCFADLGGRFTVPDPVKRHIPMPICPLPMPVDEILRGVDFYVVTHVHPDHIDMGGDGMVGAPLDKSVPVIAQNAELLKMKKDSIEDDRAFHEMENDEWWYDTFLNQIRIFNASEAAARRYYGG